MQTKILVPVLVGALALVGGSFYGGTIYAKSKMARPGQAQRGAGAVRTFGGPGGGAGGQFQGRGGAGGGFIAGEVVAKDEQGLTLKLRDGGSKVVFFSASTTVSKMSDGSLEDVAEGTEVTVVGQTNQDGSVNASNIQLRPDGAGMPQVFMRGEQAPQN